MRTVARTTALGSQGTTGCKREALGKENTGGLPPAACE